MKLAVLTLLKREPNQSVSENLLLSQESKSGEKFESSHINNCSSLRLADKEAKNPCTCTKDGVMVRLYCHGTVRLCT